MIRTTTISALSALCLLAASPTHAAGPKGGWTDSELAKKEDPDFSIQGEYGTATAGPEPGVQVVALSGGKFEAYVLQDGLPGLGWTREKKRTVLSGNTAGGSVTFSSADSAITAIIKNGSMTLTQKGEKPITLPRVVRSSPTVGAKAPKGAVVLFDGSSADDWEKGKVVDGLLAATGCLSKKKFKDAIIHIEFRTPYKPAARGQGRGNSGIYYSGRWETQVLDSFGLDGKMNECGGIYSIAAPRLNMCLPPLTWQTYDVDFTAATFDAAGKRTAWPKITVKLNGVVIHEEQELGKTHTTAAPVSSPIADEGGPIYLQNHGNPVFYRNIWVLPKK